jgi:preprotein translocase subunit SecD
LKLTSIFRDAYNRNIENWKGDLALMIQWSKILVLILVVTASFATIAVTTGDILKDIRLGLDLKGGFEILYQAVPIEKGGEVTQDLLKQTAFNLEKRINKYGVAEPDVAVEGTDRIRVTVAGVANQAELREVLKTPATLTIRDESGKVLLNGRDFVENAASIGYDESNRPIVVIKMKDAKKFAAITEKYLGQPLAIYLDEELVTAPIVQAVISSGEATITGQDSLEEAQKLKETINLGALPLNLVEKSSNSVGATLGLLSLEQSVKAGLIGSALVLIFMIIFYRVPGLIANVTLIIYVYLVLLVFTWMNVTLTLPGIAAIVLGIGMAVDANIITYERIREEIRSGKSLLSALKAGSRRSLATILDANITTIIAAGVLFYFGTGAIKGFAITLIMSILVSILTNVFLSRFLLNLVVRSNTVKKPWYFGVREDQISEL